MDEGVILRELGSRIRAQRKRVGLTQEQLALVAGVDRSYFGAVERGERNITFIVLYRLSIALKCDIAALTGNLPPTA
ncbi:MAG: hypothetical protein ABS87_14735 [Sphingomonas sp. SCN 67-18]|nr:helix-turn-helix transcriptional regulator [Sphingomonas sp. SCN 67-18]ODU18414.1 MAG: hypothetical protein ABS87_14735 [Sphingomonas sp. SCN 67-18]